MSPSTSKAAEPILPPEIKAGLQRYGAFGLGLVLLVYLLETWPKLGGLVLISVALVLGAKALEESQS